MPAEPPPLGGGFFWRTDQLMAVAARFPSGGHAVNVATRVVTDPLDFPCWRIG